MQNATNDDFLSITNGRIFLSERQQACNMDDSETMILDPLVSKVTKVGGGHLCISS